MHKLSGDTRTAMLGAANGIFTFSLFLLIDRIDSYYTLNDFQRMLGKFLDAHPGPSNEIKQIAGELLNIASRHVQELTEEKTEIKLRKAKGSD